MTNEVLIDGVKLTRAQIEEALKALNKPHPFEDKFKAGFKFRTSSLSYLVLAPKSSEWLSKGYEFVRSANTFWCVDLSSGFCSFAVKEWWLEQIIDEIL